MSRLASGELPSSEPIEPIPAPIKHDPTAVVVNTYTVPGFVSLPDTQSDLLMKEYKQDRLQPEPPPATRIVLVPTGRTAPGITRENDGTRREVIRRRRVDGHIISKKMAAGLTAASLLLFNGYGNRDTIEGAADYVGHKVMRIFNPIKSHQVTKSETTRLPGKVQTISVTASSANTVGQAGADRKAIKLFETKFRAAQAGGDKKIVVTVTGETSDDFGSDSEIGKPNSGNRRLGKQRAAGVATALGSTSLKLHEGDTVTIKRAVRENVVTSTLKRSLKAEAKADGFDSLQAAISAQDDGKQLKPKLGARIKKYFTSKEKRGVTMTATVETPAQDRTVINHVVKTVKGVDHTPAVPEPKPKLFIPFLPIRRRKKFVETKDNKRWRFNRSKTLYKPETIREDEEHAWVRVRPEALQEDGTLVKNPWAYTRIYEDLLRGGAITDVLRADFKNSEGVAKSLRIMFVEQSPATEVIEAFAEQLKLYAAMKDGALADNITGMFIYPSENAGTAHRDPRRVCLGIDKQRPANVLGTCTPVMELVDIHAPTSWDSEAIQEMFADTQGALQTMAHEVGGHGIDLKEGKQKLRRVKARKIPNAYTVEGDRWAERAEPIQANFKRLSRIRNKQAEPVEFDISYSVVDANGAAIMVNSRVKESDPRLAHATTATIVTHQPTEYAGTDVLEHFAEIAGSTVTGNVVLFEKAGVDVTPLIGKDGLPAAFTQGYRPAQDGQDLYTEAVGAERGSYPISFKNPPEVTITHTHPANDTLLREQMTRARTNRTLPPNKMLSILTRRISTFKQA